MYYFASDIHLGAGDPETARRTERRFVAWLDAAGREADMGTPVDFFGEEAHTGGEAALVAAGKISAVAARNRELLQSVMREAGLVPYRREWWHYEEPMPMPEVRKRFRLLDF